MDLDKIAIKIRPRNSWGAVDQGVHFARRWALPIYRPWLVVYGIILLLVCAVSYKSLGIAVLIIWWLKPLYDRYLLYIQSQVLFSGKPTIRETLNQTKGFIFSRSLWINLTIFRFNPNRSFDLPVWQLEGNTRKVRRQRTRALHRNTGSTPIWLIAAYSLLEIILFLSIYLLIFSLLPQYQQSTYTGGDTFTLLFDSLNLDNQGYFIQILGLALFFLIIFIIEPLYVAGGLMLYINRRTILEAWDIEINFKRINQHLKNVTKIIPAILIGLMLSTLQPIAYADNHTLLPASESKPTIEEVLSDKKYGEELTRTKLVLKKDKEPEKEEEKEPNDSFDDFFDKVSDIMSFVKYFAVAFKYALFAIVACLILWLIVYRDKWLNWKRTPKQYVDKDAPEVLFDMDITPDSLPDDLATKALALINSGNVREGIALLYRGSLSSLVYEHKAPLKDSDTERDIKRKSKQLLDDAHYSFFSRLSNAWVMIAYGHKQPDTSLIHSLCQEWPSYFKEYEHE